jgi:hypothetical protein
MSTAPESWDSSALWRCLVLLMISTTALVAADVCPVITSQPTNIYTLQCLAATFHVGVTGTPPLQFQWYRDGAPILNGTNDSYTTPFTAGYEGNYFVVIEQTGCGAVTSAVAQLYALGDVVPPSLKQVTVLPDRQHLFLSFWPCPLDAGSASELFNYAFDRGVVISNAVVQNNTNILLTTSLLEAGTRYSLTISDLRDIEGNLLYPNPTNGTVWIPPLQLSLVQGNGPSSLTWPGGGILQRSTILSGEWINVFTAAPVFALSNASPGFYRVRFPGW